MIKAAVLSVLVSVGAPAFAQAQQQFNIPGQDLASSLNQLAVSADRQIVFAPQLVKGLKAPALAGAYTLEEALRKLLEPAGLKAEYLDDKTVAVRLASESDSRESRTTLAGHENSYLRLAQNSFSSETEASSAGSSPSEDTEGRGSESESSSRITLEEVIVSAQKKEERLQDVPVPVAIVDAAELVRNGQLRLQDYYSKVPGLGLTITGNAAAPALSIRGIGATLGAANPAVGIVVDDVPYGSTINPGTPPTAADIDPGDLERIEVLRGPQGTLYGAASMGGLMKFVTIDPSTQALSGRVQVGYAGVSEGSDSGYNYRGSVNVPLGNTFAVRASAFKVRDPGYIDNIATGKRDMNRRDAEGGRLSTLWQPTENFSLKLSGLIQDSDRRGSASVNRALLLASGNLQQSAPPGTGVYDRHSEAYSATMIGKLGAIELTSVTGYSVDESYDNLDSSFFCPNVLDPFGQPVCQAASTPFNIDSTKFTQEIRATIPIGERLSWLFGAFYTDEDLTTELAVFAVDPATGAPVGVAGSPTGKLLGGPSTGAFREYAVFTNLTVDVTNRVDIQFGGRITRDKLDFSVIREPGLVNGPNPAQAPFVNLSDSSFTYLVTPRFKIAPDLMVYARLASGYRPAGANNCRRVGVPCTYEADTTLNYEVGLKGSVLDRTLSFDASLYYIDWKDTQIPVSINFSSGTIGNARRAKSQGIELSVESEPLTNLTLAGWVVWNDAELTEPLPPTSVAVGLKGDRLPNTAPFSANLSADQEFPLWSRATGFIGAAASYVGERGGAFRGSGQSPRPVFPSYVQLDLRAGVRLGSWTVDAYVNNATDKRALLSGDPDLSADFFYTQPRTVGLNVAKTF